MEEQVYKDAIADRDHRIKSLEKELANKTAEVHQLFDNVKALEEQNLFVKSKLSTSEHNINLLAEKISELTHKNIELVSLRENWEKSDLGQLLTKAWFQAKALPAGREASLIITKIDEAILWDRERIFRKLSYCNQSEHNFKVQ